MMDGDDAWLKGI